MTRTVPTHAAFLDAFPQHRQRIEPASAKPAEFRLGRGVVDPGRERRFRLERFRQKFLAKMKAARNALDRMAGFSGAKKMLGMKAVDAFLHGEACVFETILDRAHGEA